MRSSTAAPTYFEPERIDISSRDNVVVKGAFVDGGVSPYNDPPLQLLLLALLQGHGLRWRSGADKLLLISAGTGIHREQIPADELMSMPPAEQRVRALQSLMDDCLRSNQMMLQWLTNCLTPWNIDSAVGDMKVDGNEGPRLATYARYNVLLDEKWIKDKLQVEVSPDRLDKLARMGDPTNMDDLAKFGSMAAKVQVREDHFPASFDVH